MKRIEAKLKEEQFLQRLRENLESLEGRSGLQSGDELVRLRTLTGGELLRAELETEYPLGQSLETRGES